MPRALRETLAAGVLIGISVAGAFARTERARPSRHSRLRERQRHFGLLAGEPAAAGLKRAALGQLGLATELLGGESHMPAAQSVHETRKALKRVGALLRLLEDELGQEHVARERALLRDAASGLAGARDTYVMRSTLDALVRRHPRRLAHRRGVAELRAHLERERVAATRALGDPAAGGRNGSDGVAAGRVHALSKVSAVRTQVALWSLDDRPLGVLVESGLGRIYREGRLRWRRAARPKPTARSLHRWRKHVKDLRYAAEVITVQNGADEGMIARKTGRLTKLARQADSLGELLGQERDLGLLAEVARADETFKRHKRSRRALLRSISRTRARLRKEALRTGARLYARKPKRFLGRMRGSWTPTIGA